MTQCGKDVISGPDEMITKLSEVSAVLAGISQGDTTVRFPEPAENDLFRTLKILINQLAEHIQETNSQAHEMAIGLCEHYDTLNRIAKGDFSARAAESSENELIAKLGKLINLEADTVTSIISRVQEAEEAHQSQLQFIRVMLDTIPSPIFYKDAECHYLGCNKAFEKYVGLSQAELIGKSAHEVWPAELADSYRQQDLALLSNPGMQTYETKVTYADGTLRDVMFNKATFVDSEGAVGGLVGVILDITERKIAEDSTKNAYQQLFDIVEFLPDATFVIDKDKRVIAWNRAIEQMTGIVKSEILGKRDYLCSMAFYGDNRPLLVDLLGKEQDPQGLNYTHVKQEGHSIFAEVFIPSFRGGGSRYLWATATPLFDRKGNQSGGIESIRDITEYKQAEEARERLESQLNHARMLENFMVRLGHDLRTPLTPLFVLFPLIKARINDPELLRMLEICANSTTAIKNLLDRAQMLVRLSATVKTDEFEHISLIAAAEAAINDNVNGMAKKNITCLNTIDPLIQVYAVREQLRELFANLISNAVRFSYEKSVIRIEAEMNSDTVTVAIHDNGIGLDPDHLECIFDEFFKADDSRHELEAPGLGLSICKRIALNHHGRIWAESTGKGKGTTIKFTVNEK